MAMHENSRRLSVLVAVTASVAGALPNRFCELDTTGEYGQVKTFVPGANGGVPDGILAMKADTANVKDGVVASSMALPDGAQQTIELGEAVTKGDLIRCGGNSSEVDGAAYLADASGDVIVGKAIEAGAVGEIVSILFTGHAGTVA